MQSSRFCPSLLHLGERFPCSVHLARWGAACFDALRRREEEDGGGRKRGQIVGEGHGKRQVRRRQQRRAEIVPGKAPHPACMVDVVLQSPPQDPRVQECAENISYGISSQGSPGCMEVVFD